MPGKTGPRCAVCQVAAAAVFCVNDDAHLCTLCDVKFHANPLAARHERRPLIAVAAVQASESATDVKTENFTENDVAVVPQWQPMASAPAPAPAAPSPAIPAADEADPLLFTSAPPPMRKNISVSDLLDFESQLLDFSFPISHATAQQELTDGVVPSFGAGNGLLEAGAYFPAQVGSCWGDGGGAVVNCGRR
jgi:hypothetical protein